MESADDLLRTKSIYDLRSLVASLESSATAKKSELQYTVGSKYHEFIESADAISDMFKKAHSIEQNLQHFPEFTQQIISLMSSKFYKSNDSTRGNTTVISMNNHEVFRDGLKNVHELENYLSFAVKTSLKPNNSLQILTKSIWLLLDDCNVYEASQLIYVSSVLAASNLPKFEPLKKLLLSSVNLREVSSRSSHHNWR
jgi:hypothetical protein